MPQQREPQDLSISPGLYSYCKRVVANISPTDLTLGTLTSAERSALQVIEKYEAENPEACDAWAISNTAK